MKSEVNCVVGGDLFWSRVLPSFIPFSILLIKMSVGVPGGLGQGSLKENGWGFIVVTRCMSFTVLER